MVEVELAPLRSWSDCFPGFQRFSRPDVNDLSRWNKRVVGNLLYYQTNYLTAAVAAFFVASFLDPVRMFLTLAAVSGIYAVSLRDNRAVIRAFKRQSPIVCAIGAAGASCLLLSLLGSVTVFVSLVALTLIFAHASLRLRNMKNKLENKLECTGLKRSPMGLFLETLGQQDETLQQIQNLLEAKLQ